MEPRCFRRPGGSGAISGRAPFVAMMKAAELGNGDDASDFRPLDRPRLRCILRQRELSAQFTIITQESLHVPIQQSYPEHGHVVQTLSPDGTNHPLHVCSLPRRSRSGEHLLDSPSLSRPCETHDRKCRRGPEAGSAEPGQRGTPLAVAALSIPQWGAANTLRQPGRRLACRSSRRAPVAHCRSGRENSATWHARREILMLPILWGALS